MGKLYRMSRVRGAVPEADTVGRSMAWGERGRGAAVLLQAQVCYMNMDRFRRDRERNKRYNYGDQWSDIICVDGERMTEEQYIMRQGNIPLKNNIIRRLTRNVIGVFRSQSTEPTCVARDREEQRMAETMSTVLQYNMQLNRMKELYARTMEEFLISGLIVHRKWYGWLNNKEDCWTEYIQPNNFFVDNNMRDFRGWDCSCIGEIHDIPFEALSRQFARTPADYERLSEIYRTARDATRFARAWDSFGYPMEHNHDFLVPKSTGLCRVIEVWRKESKPRYRCRDYNTGEIYKIELTDYDTMVARENDRRLRQAAMTGIPTEEVPLIKTEWFIDDYWYYYYLTPFGDILDEGETPYGHKSHPYVFKAYPFIDGEIHSFVSDIIDQQRYTNRLITLYDWIMRASAKGVLLIPEDCIPKGMSPEQFAESWSRFNGVVVYKPNQRGEIPKQISCNSTNIGIYELLQLQLKLVEDISGVNGALQGKPGYSGMSAALYNQQTQNATVSLLDLLESFDNFMIEAAYKDVKNIQQYYDQKRIFNIAGRAGIKTDRDPQKIRDVEFDLNIVPSTATPAYRKMANEFLMEIWKAGQITLQQMLKVGSFEFGDELLQVLESQDQQMEQGQMPDSIPPELMSRIQQGADPRAMQMVGDYVLK